MVPEHLPGPYRDHAPRNPYQTGDGTDRVIPGGGWDWMHGAAAAAGAWAFQRPMRARRALGFRVVAVVG